MNLTNKNGKSLQDNKMAEKKQVIAQEEQIDFIKLDKDINTTKDKVRKLELEVSKIPASTMRDKVVKALRDVYDVLKTIDNSRKVFNVKDRPVKKQPQTSVEEDLQVKASAGDETMNKAMKLAKKNNVNVQVVDENTLRMNVGALTKILEETYVNMPRKNAEKPILQMTVGDLQKKMRDKNGK